MTQTNTASERTFEEMKKDPINPNVLELCKFIASHDNIVDYGSMFDEIKNASKEDTSKCMVLLDGYMRIKEFLYDDYMTNIRYERYLELRKKGI